MSKKPLKVLHVVPSYYPAIRYGGPIESVHGLCKGLVQSGMEVHVYTTNVNGEDDSDVPLDVPVNIDGVKVWYFQSSYGRRLYYSRKMKYKLIDHMCDFDIVHLHSVFLWPTWMAARCAARQGVPYVISPRGMLVSDLIKRKSRWVKTLWINLIEKKSFRQAAGIHATSEVEIKELSNLGLNIPFVFCIANGVEIPSDLDLDQNNNDTAYEKPYVLYLGRINWKKGLDRLIKSWKSVKDVNLIVAGNDEENFQNQLENLARTEGVSERIQFIGSVKGTQKWSLYRHAALLVLPSYSENFGNVVLEAISVGCPVVITPEVGLAPMVSQYTVGSVVKGDPLTLASEINALISDEQLRSNMSRNGVRVARCDYTWVSIANKMKNMYIQIVSAS